MLLVPGTTLTPDVNFSWNIHRQREDARETVREFARRCIVEQARWKRAEHQEIRVLFANEPAGAIKPFVR